MLRKLIKFEEIPMKALLVYGTRYGATAGTSEEIAKTLREESLDVKVVNAKEEKIKDISEYDLIIVGSGVQMGKWTGEVEDFLKRFQAQFAQKKLAVFVSSMKTIDEREGKLDKVEEARKWDIDGKIEKYGLKPMAIGFFGGVLDFNKMNFLFRRTMGFIKSQLEKDGFKQTQPDVYELRDWEEIRKWARELSQKARQ
jgi:menaquinone-dependent protoporphyrinogen oxidase